MNIFLLSLTYELNLPMVKMNHVQHVYVKVFCANTYKTHSVAIALLDHF